MPKYWANYAGNFDVQPDEIHEQFGFYPVYFPPFNPQLQDRSSELLPDLVNIDGKLYYTYSVTDKVFDLEALKQGHYDTVDAVSDEISLIVSKVKNIYDPWRSNPENIPVDFVALVDQRIPWMQQAQTEIASLNEF